MTQVCPKRRQIFAKLVTLVTDGRTPLKLRNLTQESCLRLFHFHPSSASCSPFPLSFSHSLTTDGRTDGRAKFERLTTRDLKYGGDVSFTVLRFCGISLGCSSRTPSCLSLVKCSSSGILKNHNAEVLWQLSPFPAVSEHLIGSVVKLFC